MEASTLSKKQQKKTLSAKKAAKKLVRNTLDNPFYFDWPDIDFSTEEKIKGLIKELCDGIAKPSSRIPSSELKGLTLKEKIEKRKLAAAEQKKALMKDEKYEKKLRLWADIVVGVNAVTRAVEKDQLGVVIASRDTEPRFMLTFLIPLCATRQCPLVGISRLSPLCQHLLGLKSCSVFGIKKTAVGKEDWFYRLYAAVADVSGSEITTMNQKKLEQFSKSPEISSESIENVDDVVARLHLPRLDLNVRAFVPKRDNHIQAITEQPGVSPSYISFSKYKRKAESVTNIYIKTKIKQVKIDSNKMTK